ncbi:MAG TPA: ATP-binding protein, partial [Clostridiales bacterium]|nr:ATP-binding protein [Clostridiales bacterium]
MMENDKVEFKESWRDEYLKVIAGFANSNGGTLYIGCTDNGEVIGV